MLIHKRIIHPEHSTWWDKNEKRLLIYCFTAMVILLLFTFLLVKIVEQFIWVGILWITLLFIHSMVFYVCMSRTEDLH